MRWGLLLTYREPDPLRRFPSISRSIPDQWVERELSIAIATNGENNNGDGDDDEEGGYGYGYEQRRRTLFDEY